VSLAELVDHPLVLEAVTDGVARAGERLSRVEQVKRFTLLGDEWAASGDELIADHEAQAQGDCRESRGAHRVAVRLTPAVRTWLYSADLKRPREDLNLRPSA
jgi:long-subunit acyl-CoA synthetase (AMP-forming)